MSKKENITTNNTLNILSNGTLLAGDVRSEEDIRIDGTIEGNITCKGKIIIGHSGKIKGDILCATLDLMGSVNGNIKSSGISILRSTSVMTGNIETDILEVEPGAHIVCDRIVTKINGTDIVKA